MTQAPAGAAGLVRVTVASGSRRVDLVLPGTVPVAELVPELARSVGLLDAATVYGGYRVVLADGRVLSGDAGLTAQGVEDGGLLAVTAAVDDEPPRVYDDVVEAMTDVVERDLRPWRPEAGRRTALVAAALLLALGAVALLVQGASQLSGVAAGIIALVLVGGAVVLSRSEKEPEAAVALAWMAQLYAAVGGLLLGLHHTDGTPWALPVAFAGAGAVVTGLLCLVGLTEGRTLCLPGTVVGVIFLGTGLIVRAAGWDPAVVLTVVLVVVVLIGSIFPWLALSMTGTNVDELFSPADITRDPDDIDAAQVASDARVAHEILVGISATVGLLLVLVAPLAVSLGLSGTLLAVAACCVVMLRTRQYRTGTQVLVGLVSGIAGLLVTALAALWLHPDWRPTAAIVLAVVGGVLLALTMVPSTPSVRRGRAADVAEMVAMLTLLPLVVLATGLFSAVEL